MATDTSRALRCATGSAHVLQQAHRGRPTLEVTDVEAAGVMELAKESLRTAADLNSQLQQTRRTSQCGKRLLALVQAVAEILEEHLAKLDKQSGAR